MVSTWLGNRFDGGGKAFKSLEPLDVFAPLLKYSARPRSSPLKLSGLPQLLQLLSFLCTQSVLTWDFPSPFMPPPPPHSSLLKFIAVLISCHSKRLSLIATDERFHVGRSPNRSCQPRGNGREALVIGFLNYVNSSGHLVIGFTVFDGVFEIVLECYWGEQLVKFYSWIQRRKWHL